MEPTEQKQIETLIQLVESEDLLELTIEDGDERICIRRARNPARCLPLLAHPAHNASSGCAQQPVAVRTEESAKASIGEANPNWVHIISPLVGIFYRSPTPGVPPFVEVGDWVEEGQTVGLVEAMKVFNEIVAEVDGKVVGIPAKDEQLVQHGDTLVIIERIEA